MQGRRIPFGKRRSYPGRVACINRLPQTCYGRLLALVSISTANFVLQVSRWSGERCVASGLWRTPLHRLWAGSGITGTGRHSGSDELRAVEYPGRGADRWRGSKRPGRMATVPGCRGPSARTEDNRTGSLAGSTVQLCGRRWCCGRYAGRGGMLHHRRTW
jgi:hypothetical protein